MELSNATRAEIVLEEILAVMIIVIGSVWERTVDLELNAFVLAAAMAILACAYSSTDRTRQDVLGLMEEDLAVALMEFANKRIIKKGKLVFFYFFYFSSLYISPSKNASAIIFSY